MSRRALAQELGVPVTTLLTLERRRVLPPWSGGQTERYRALLRLWQVAKAAGVPPSVIRTALELNDR